MAESIIKKVTNDSGNGYCKMPDGTLIQWGEFIGKAGDAVNFQIAFNSIPNVHITARYNTATTAKSVFSTSAISKTSFLVYAWDTQTQAISTVTNLYAHWLAIGRWK